MTSEFSSVCVIILHTWRLFFLLAVFRLLRFLPAFLLAFLRPLRRQRSLRFPPFQLRQLGLHLHDEHLQFLLTLLAGMGVDIAGVFLAVWPLGRIAPLEEMVADLADAAGAGSALAAHIGLSGCRG